jgi:hypothetical protein
VTRPVVVAGLLVAAALSACRGQPAPPSPPVAASDASLRITLERRPCYGTCPFYRLALAGDGTLRYEGVRFVQREGALEEPIPSARVVALADSLAAGGFAGMADRYVSGEAACGLYAADAPVVIASLTRNGVTKTVEHDQGCAGAPRALAALQDLIDEVARSWRWTTGREP